MQSVDILRELISFPTVSRSSNLHLIEYVRSLLEPLGASSEIVGGEGGRANLWVTVGPADRPGVVLSGHSDVVPVDGQDWTREPFMMEEADGRLYGRGTADMKGFVACAIACLARAARRPLQAPLYLAISYDEEIGCIGVRSLIEALETRQPKPALCIVGEPTSMRVAVGHKGKAAFRATCIGLEAHSALSPSGLNAIHLATEFVAGLRILQDKRARGPAVDDDYDVPYSTIHAGVIRGGEALNIVPALCTVDFEIRNIAADDIGEIAETIGIMAGAICEPYREMFPQVAIRIELLNAYPGLDTAHEGAIKFMTGLTGANDDRLKLAFGTEAGLFSQCLALPAIICGPGSMEQGHKPDEYVAREQLAICDQVLARLVDRLEAGPVAI